MSQCEACRWALFLDGRLYCQHPTPELTSSEAQACQGHAAGAPKVEWRTQKPKGKGWQQISAR